MKLAWFLMSRKSLWAQFFREKYIKATHWSMVDLGRGTRTWKMIARCILKILQHSCWKVKQGNVFFWKDKWMNSGALCDQMSMVGRGDLKLMEVSVENDGTKEKLSS